MQPRLQRYEQFIKNDFIPSLLWNKDFSLDALHPELVQKIRAKKFQRIIFTGMGCSAIVADVIKGFFAHENIPIFIDVINDCDHLTLIDPRVIHDVTTLFVISSYSGFSQEPIIFYESIKALTQNIIFLTSGGELAEIAVRDHISIIRWQLRNPDREYPLFHVPQYFAVLCDIFFELGVLDRSCELQLKKVSEDLARSKDEIMLRAHEIAAQLDGRELVCIASPLWHRALLKLANMHINEMAMSASHRNRIHEFGHSEIAALTKSRWPVAIVNFLDEDDNSYVHQKSKILRDLFLDQSKEGRNNQYVEIKISGGNFVEKFFSTLLLVNMLALELGVRADITSRELISLAAGNLWYNKNTIQNKNH